MSAKSSAKPAAKSSSPLKPVLKQASKPAPAIKTMPVSKPVQKTAAPIVKKSAPRAITTTIAAQVDVGFGNTLYIRGEGPGLDWEKGLPMACVANDKWAVSLTNASKPITCKFLINDLIWCAGEDFVVTPGTSVSFVPIF